MRSNTLTRVSNNPGAVQLSIFPELKPLNISTSRTSSFITAYG